MIITYNKTPIREKKSLKALYLVTFMKIFLIIILTGINIILIINEIFENEK